MKLKKFSIFGLILVFALTLILPMSVKAEEMDFPTDVKQKMKDYGITTEEFEDLPFNPLKEDGTIDKEKIADYLMKKQESDKVEEPRDEISVIVHPDAILPDDEKKAADDYILKKASEMGSMETYSIHLVIPKGTTDSEKFILTYSNYIGEQKKDIYIGINFAGVFESFTYDINSVGNKLKEDYEFDFIINSTTEPTIENVKFNVGKAEKKVSVDSQGVLWPDTDVLNYYDNSSIDDLVVTNTLKLTVDDSQIANITEDTTSINIIATTNELADISCVNADFIEKNSNKAVIPITKNGYYEIYAENETSECQVYSFIVDGFKSKTDAMITAVSNPPDINIPKFNFTDAISTLVQTGKNIHFSFYLAIGLIVIGVILLCYFCKKKLKLKRISSFVLAILFTFSMGLLPYISSEAKSVFDEGNGMKPGFAKGTSTQEGTPGFDVHHSGVPVDQCDIHYVNEVDDSIHSAVLKDYGAFPFTSITDKVWSTTNYFTVTLEDGYEYYAFCINPSLNRPFYDGDGETAANGGHSLDILGDNDPRKKLAYYLYSGNPDLDYCAENTGSFEFNIEKPVVDHVSDPTIWFKSPARDGTIWSKEAWMNWAMGNAHNIAGFYYADMLDDPSIFLHPEVYAGDCVRKSPDLDDYTIVDEGSMLVEDKGGNPVTGDYLNGIFWAKKLKELPIPNSKKYHDFKVSSLRSKGETQDFLIWGVPQDESSEPPEVISTASSMTATVSGETGIVDHHGYTLTDNEDNQIYHSPSVTNFGEDNNKGDIDDKLLYVGGTMTLAPVTGYSSEGGAGTIITEEVPYGTQPREPEPCSASLVASSLDSAMNDLNVVRHKDDIDSADYNAGTVSRVRDYFAHGNRGNDTAIPLSYALVTDAQSNFSGDSYSQVNLGSLGTKLTPHGYYDENGTVQAQINLDEAKKLSNGSYQKDDDKYHAIFRKKQYYGTWYEYYYYYSYSCGMYGCSTSGPITWDNAGEWGWLDEIPENQDWSYSYHYSGEGWSYGVTCIHYKNYTPTLNRDVYDESTVGVAINVWCDEPEVTSHMVVTHINQDDPSKNYVETTNYPEKYFKHSSHTYVFPENTVKYGIYHDDPIANWTDWQASMNMCRTETVGGKSCCVGSQPSYDDDLGYTVYVLVNDKPTDDGDPHDPSVPGNPGNPDDPVEPVSYGELTDASIQRTNSTRVQVDDWEVNHIYPNILGGERVTRNDGSSFLYGGTKYGNCVLNRNIVTVKTGTVTNVHNVKEPDGKGTTHKITLISDNDYHRASLKEVDAETGGLTIERDNGLIASGQDVNGALIFNSAPYLNANYKWSVRSDAKDIDGMQFDFDQLELANLLGVTSYGWNSLRSLTGDVSTLSSISSVPGATVVDVGYAQRVLGMDYDNVPKTNNEVNKRNSDAKVGQYNDKITLATTYIDTGSTVKNLCVGLAGTEEWNGISGLKQDFQDMAYYDNVRIMDIVPYNVGDNGAFKVIAQRDTIQIFKPTMLYETTGKRNASGTNKFDLTWHKNGRLQFTVHTDVYKYDTVAQNDYAVANQDNRNAATDFVKVNYQKEQNESDTVSRMKDGGETTIAFTIQHDIPIDYYPEVEMIAYECKSNVLDQQNYGSASRLVATMGEELRKSKTASLYFLSVKNAANGAPDIVGDITSDAFTTSYQGAGGNIPQIYSGSDVTLQAKNGANNQGLNFTLNAYGYSIDLIDKNNVMVGRDAAGSPIYGGDNQMKISGSKSISYKTMVADDSDVFDDWGNAPTNHEKLYNDFNKFANEILNQENYDVDVQLEGNGKKYKGFSASFGDFIVPDTDKNAHMDSAYPIAVKHGKVYTAKEYAEDIAHLTKLIQGVQAWNVPSAQKILANYGLDAAVESYNYMISQLAVDYDLKNIPVGSDGKIDLATLTKTDANGNYTNDVFKEAQKIFNNSEIATVITNAIESDNDDFNASADGTTDLKFDNTRTFNVSEILGNRGANGAGNWYDEQVKTIVVRRYAKEGIKVNDLVLQDKVDYDMQQVVGANPVYRWYFTLFMNKEALNNNDKLAKYYSANKNTILYSPDKNDADNQKAIDAGTVPVHHLYISGADFRAVNNTTNMDTYTGDGYSDRR